jgi:hypothetical protein
MKTLNLPCEIFRSLAGLVIGGTGIFRLFTHLVGATEQLTSTLDQTSGARMQLLSWIMLASSFNAHRLEHDLLSVLWPLLPSLVGSVLLWSAACRQSTQDRQPCTRWA